MEIYDDSLPGPTPAAAAESNCAALTHSAGVAIATTSAPAEVRKARRLNSFNWSSSIMTASRPRCAQHCPDRRVVGAATANQVGERISHVLLCRMRIARQQFSGCHDPAADTVGTLVDLLRDPCRLQRMRFLRRSQTRQRGDLAIGNQSDGRDARANSLAIDVHGAG